VKKIIIIAASAASICLTATLGAAAGSKAEPAASPAVEAKITSVCQNCHGPRGDSVSSVYPRLNGQKADYVVSQLKHFRDHSRTDPHAQAYMWSTASQLDDAMVAALAKYYAGQTPTSPQSGGALAADGEKIFKNGIAAEKIPACHVCHGEHGEGSGALFPRIAGQHAAYLRMQLGLFRSMLRGNEVMHANTKNMTDTEIEALASYLGND
jgi:cytochrome c553